MKNDYTESEVAHFCAEPIMSIDKLTEDEKHNWKDLTLDEQRRVMDENVPFNTKAIILTCDGVEDACYLCKRAFSTEYHLRQHIKAHLRKMGATGEAYVSKKIQAQRPRRHGCKETQ